MMESKVGSSPDAVARDRGWLGIVGMVFVIFFGMKAFMATVLGGVAGAMIGAALAAMLAWGLGKLWGLAGVGGRLLVLIAGAGVVFVGIVLSQMASSSALRQASPGVAPIPAQQQPPASSEARPPWDELQQVGAVAPAAGGDVQVAWDADIDAWRSQNAEFLSDPARRAAMERQLERLDADQTLSNAALIARAEAAAFAETGWPPAPVVGKPVQHLAPKSDRCWNQYLASVRAIPEDAALGYYAQAEQRARDRLELCKG
ncbi:hypothetical protein FQY83_14180 [Luteimonas marina]|uniref:Uncharacterized protein n=1 Tax=Luteimonas marina TaxID=488485 RepID=A0A5C5TWD6_9GAMM|nr:hypothetical protein [Luteimonas marina]TWT18523.1 hypothetical protein FQY83_14180 [Luteimonas marina]